MTLESLAAYDNFQFAELCHFKQIYQLETEDTITGTEPFPGEMLLLKNDNISLPNDIYSILVKYYNAKVVCLNLLKILRLVLTRVYYSFIVLAEFWHFAILPKLLSFSKQPYIMLLMT